MKAEGRRQRSEVRGHPGEIDKKKAFHRVKRAEGKRFIPRLHFSLNPFGLNTWKGGGNFRRLFCDPPRWDRNQMRKIPIDKKGFSLLEIIITLAIISILVSALIPVIASKLEDARTGRARDDVQVIAAAIGKFYMDTSLFPIWEDGSKVGAFGCQPDYDVLASADGKYPAGMSARGWSKTRMDTLENQLVFNKPGYPESGTDCWRGPYLSINKGKRLNKDPWGNRYLVNVKGLYTPKTVVMVISAGPNEIIETSACQDYRHFRIGGDDIVCTIK